MKTAIYIGSGVCSVIGAYIPVWLWGADVLDISSLVGGFIGAIAGMWVGYKLAKMADV